MTPTDNVVQLRPDQDEDDGSDEVAVMIPETPTEVLGAPADDVKLAVDPPKGSLSLADLTGIDLPERRLIVPRWMRSWADAKAVALWLVRYVGNLITFHVTRAPKYAYRAVLRTFVGAGRTIAAYWAWVWDKQGRQMAALAMKGADQGAWKAARKEWRETVHRRLLGSLFALLGGVGVVVTAYLLAPPEVVALALVAVVGVLVKLGAPEDRPLVDAYYTSKPGATFKLTSKMVVTALRSLGIANINAALKEDPKDGVRFAKPITTDGPGFRAEVDLPHGVTAAMVMEKRSELASGLRRPLGTVWPESAPEVHAGRLVLWVGNQDMAKLNKKPPYDSPNHQADSFGALPFGFDQRGRPISFPMIYENALIGSLPGGGKTSAVRGLLLGVALDPTPEIRVAEHKGSGDLAMFEQLAHFYVSGVADEDIEATVMQLRGLLKEVARRAEVVKKLSKDGFAPDAKVTRQMANMKHLRLRPIFFVIDECQELFSHDDYGKEAGKLAERIIKRGRAFGVILILATQRPDKDSLPTGVSANVSIRYCLRVMGQVENDMILGTSSYKNGIQATTLSPRDKGIGYLKGAFDDAVVVRSYYSNTDAANRIARRAHEARVTAGTITGQAAGDRDDSAPSFSLLGDLHTIFVSSERLHSEDICSRLRELRPDAYADWTADTLAEALPEGISTTQIKISGKNRRGLRREQLVAGSGSAGGVPELAAGADRDDD